MEEKMIEKMRHGLSHVLAKAVGQIYTDVKYAITFTCDLGSTTKYLTKGTTITVPTEYSNYDWAPKFTTGDKVTGNANYVGTPKAST